MQRSQSVSFGRFRQRPGLHIRRLCQLLEIAIVRDVEIVSGPENDAGLNWVGMPWKAQSCQRGAGRRQRIDDPITRIRVVADEQCPRTVDRERKRSRQRRLPAKYVFAAPVRFPVPSPVNSTILPPMPEGVSPTKRSPLASSAIGIGDDKRNRPGRYGSAHAGLGVKRENSIVIAYPR